MLSGDTEVAESRLTDLKQTEKDMCGPGAWEAERDIDIAMLKQSKQRQMINGDSSSVKWGITVSTSLRQSENKNTYNV